MVDDFNLKWFRWMYNTGGYIMPTEDRYNNMYEYYLNTEDYEKLDFMVKAKKVHETYEKTGIGLKCIFLFQIFLFIFVLN